MKHRFFTRFSMLTGVLLLTAPLSCSASAAWEAAQIADALRAAPPTVTANAKLYAWRPSGQLVLVRDGPGPYTCVASGSASLRFGQSPLPYPDSFCAVQHAWAFIQAYWTEEDPDPTEGIRPLPHTPGLVWMLAAQRDGQATADITITRQLMILPLPIDPAAAPLPGTDAPRHPLTLWMTARGNPIGHAPIHVPAAVHQTLMAMPPAPAR
jgi:hypothetical protein